MRILTNANLSYSISQIPDDSEEILYCVLDYTNQSDVDYYFLPLKYLESFHSPCIDLKIGPFNIQMPLEWSIVIGDMHLGDLEIMPLIYLMDKDFDIFCLNPIRGYMPQFHKLEIINTWPDVKWYFPKLKNGHLLAVPLEEGDNPMCAFFVKDTNKLPESLDIRKLI